MSLPLVSILIPVYNTGRFLSDCFESIKSQSYKNIEVVFVNDGSTDNSEEQIKNFCHQNHFARLISQPNQGPSVARNVGIANSKGEFVYFYDSDDILHPEVIKTYVSQIGQCDLITSGFNYIKEGQKFCHLNCKKNLTDVRSKTFTSKKEIYSEFLKTFKSFFTRTSWNKLYRRSILEKIKNYPNVYNPDIVLGEDCNFLCKYLEHCKSIKCLHKNLYFYRKRKSSLMRKSFHKGYLSLIKCLDPLNKLNFNQLPKIESYLSSLYIIHSFIVLYKLYASKDVNAQREYYGEVVSCYKKYKKVCIKSKTTKLKIDAILTMPCFAILSSLIKRRIKNK